MNKKLCFNSLIAAALLLTGLGANAASEVESLCLKTKIQGNYKSRSTDESHDYLIMQDGCRLGIIEHQYIQYDHPQNKTITWNFDLSGKTEFEIPLAVLEANRSSDLGLKSLKSFRGKMKLELDREYHFPYIEVEGIIQLPVTATNNIATEFKITGKIDLGGNPIMPPDQTYSSGFIFKDGIDHDSQVLGYSVNNLNLRNIRVRAVAQNTLPQVMTSAFLLGVNYVLEFLDRVYLTGFVLPTLQGIEAKETK